MRRLNLLNQLKEYKIKITKLCVTVAYPYLRREFDKLKTHRIYQLVAISFAGGIVIVVMTITLHAYLNTQHQPNKVQQYSSKSNVVQEFKSGRDTKSEIASLRQSIQQMDIRIEQVSSQTTQLTQEVKATENSLQTTLRTLEDNMNSVNAQSQKTNADTQKHLKTDITQGQIIKQKLSSIEKVLQKPRYLPVSVLPFKAIGIDFWNGRPMATLLLTDIHGTPHYQLMGEGMAFSCGSEGSKNNQCGRWVLSTIDVQKHQLIFTNDDGHAVKVKV